MWLFLLSLAAAGVQRTAADEYAHEQATWDLSMNDPEDDWAQGKTFFYDFPRTTK